MNNSNIFYRYLNIRKRHLRAMWLNFIASIVCGISFTSLLIIAEGLNQPNPNYWLVLGLCGFAMVLFVLSSGIVMSTLDDLKRFKKREKELRLELLKYHEPRHHQKAQFLTY